LFCCIFGVENILIVAGAKKLIPLKRTKVGKIFGLRGDSRELFIEDHMKLWGDCSSL
jgi:hypothetical protein